ncbi:hypothetical protein EMIT0196MI5_120048 [Pseudomonas sp. IT-196MI5]
MGAVWVSGAPVAKPIPKIKADRSTTVIHPGSRNRARGAGGTKLQEGVEHGMSPMDGSSLLEAGTQIQSENAIGQRRHFLSLERTHSASQRQTHRHKAIDQVLVLARQERRPALRLTVFENNPAQALYERKGLRGGARTSVS